MDRERLGGLPRRPDQPAATQRGAAQGLREADRKFKRPRHYRSSTSLGGTSSAFIFVGAADRDGYDAHYATTLLSYTTHEGFVTQRYSHDALGRLVTTTREEVNRAAILATLSRCVDHDVLKEAFIKTVGIAGR